MNIIKQYWLKIPLNIRKEIISGVITFISVFAITVDETLELDQTISWTVVTALVGVALRAAIKVVVRDIIKKYEKS